MTLASQRRRHTPSLTLSKGALGACTTRVSLLPPASPYSVHRRRQNHPANPQAHQLFSSRPQQEHKAPRRLRHAARMPHRITSSQARDPGSVSPLQRGRSRARTPRGRRGGQAGGRTPDIPWGSRQPRSSRSRAGREQAGQEHSGLLATRAEETAAASPVQAVGLQLQRRGARGRPRSMSASRPW